MQSEGANDLMPRPVRSRALCCPCQISGMGFAPRQYYSYGGNHKMSEELRILLVEDDASIRDFLSLALTDEGYRVATAQNGWVGLTVVDTFQPHLIILDMNLPVINGPDFVSLYVGLPQTAPIIGISAMRNGKEYAERAGILDFLEKPFSLDDLMKRISTALS